uniref:autotransporter outer membrane beta-barrel domain-containing protein n=1 Tax=Fusobacterium sp. TaxID=68766 RepID=UPI002626035A
YSNKVSKKTMTAITDDILSSGIKSKENEWVFGGKILGQNSDNKNEFYGRNLHEVDGGKSEVKVDSNISGAYAYGEYGLKSNASLGFVVGGTKSSTDISGNSKLKGNSISILSYAKKDINNLQLKAGIGYQHSFYDSTRTVSNAYQSMSVKKEYKDNAFNMFGGAKYSYFLGKEIYVEPYFNVIFSYVNQDEINEENNQSLTMSVKKKSFNSLDTETGIDLVKKLNLSKGELKLKVGTSLMYAIDGYENEYLTGKINGATKDFEILSAESDRTRAKIKTSMEYELENGISYNINGEYITSSKNKDYKVGIGIGYKF